MTAAAHGESALRRGAQAIYGLAVAPGLSADLSDITSGAGVDGYSATMGYDFVTGFGSAVANVPAPNL